jgi:hypothetical protein
MVTNSATLNELDSVPADEKRLRTNYAEVKSVNSDFKVDLGIAANSCRVQNGSSQPSSSPLL